MSSLSSKDRVSLCSFTFSDGRQCRTPRSTGHPHFCSDHARKDSQARAADKLGRDLSYFFSGQYLSACDLSTALASLLPAVVRGHVKPKTARTLAYLAQTLLQAIRMSQHEYINAFGADGWRKAVRESVNANRDYRFPPAPAVAPKQPASPQPQPAAQAANVRAGGTCPGPARKPVRFRLPNQPQPNNPPQPAAQLTPPALVCHPERSEGSHPIPAAQCPKPEAPPVRPGKPLQTSPPTPKRAPARDSRAVHFDHSRRLLVDGKPF